MVLTKEQMRVVRLIADELKRTSNQTYIDQAHAVMRVVNREREQEFREIRESFN